MEYEMGLRPKIKQGCKQVNKHTKSHEKINMQTITQNIKIKQQKNNDQLQELQGNMKIKKTRTNITTSKEATNIGKHLNKG